jgi:hypothetical protein
MTLNHGRQSFRKAYTLSFTSASWWYNDVAQSYLEEVLPLEEYNAARLRDAAILAHKTWLGLLRTQGTKQTRVHAPTDSDHYGDCIPAGTHWLFHVAPSNDFSTSTLVCYDLRNGAIVGRYALPTYGRADVITFAMTSVAKGTNSVQLALLCKGENW